MKESKKFYDALHGFIHLDGIECELLQHRAFTRLRDIKQLGATYLVYPGAHHTRFEHSLGVMHIATRIFERFINQLPKNHILWVYRSFFRQILRLGALCHDMGHLPFSHVAEKSVFLDRGHEAMTAAILNDMSLKNLFAQIESPHSLNIDSAESIRKIAIGHKKWAEIGEKNAFTSIEIVLSQMITDDFFGADRIDYLLRDGRALGLPYGAFDYLQLIEHITPVLEKNSIQMAIEEEGIEACESLLLARYFMSHRVYLHPAIKALSFHLARLIHHAAQKDQLLASIDQYLSKSDADIHVMIKAIAHNEKHPLYYDANVIQKPTTAYKVFRIKEQDIALCRQLNIDSHIEINPYTGQEATLNFNVKCKEGAIVGANTLSTLQMPKVQHHFVYTHPKNYTLLKKHLSRRGL